MASSAISPVRRAQSAESSTSSATIDLDSYPVPPDWIITDPDEDRRHVLAMIEQGERAIAAGRTTDGAEVQRRMRERILARRSSSSSQ
jgi:alkylation response protein AidB-like acyl-CoA dehydrogenase